MALGKGCEMLTCLGVGEIEEGIRDHEDIMTLLRDMVLPREKPERMRTEMQIILGSTEKNLNLVGESERCGSLK